MKYKLIKKGERKGRTGTRVIYIEWGEDGKYKESYNNIKIGRSLLLDVGGWLTTPIVSIENTTPKSISFTTKNSQYKLTWK